MSTTYRVEYVPEHGSESKMRILYDGPSKPAAKRACARALGYRDLRSALGYTGETPSGDDAEYYVQRRECRALGEYMAVARIVVTS